MSYCETLVSVWYHVSSQCSYLSTVIAAQGSALAFRITVPNSTKFDILLQNSLKQTQLNFSGPTERQTFWHFNVYASNIESRRKLFMKERASCLSSEMQNSFLEPYKTFRIKNWGRGRTIHWIFNMFIIHRTCIITPIKNPKLWKSSTSI